MTQENRAESRDLPVHKFFKAAIDLNAAEFHLQVGKPAEYWIEEILTPLEMPLIEHEKWRELCLPFTDIANRENFAIAENSALIHVVEYKGKQWPFRINMRISGNESRMVAHREW